MLSQGPAHVICPLEAIFDVQVGIAAAPTGEFRRSGQLTRVIERNARETQQRTRKQSDIILLREINPVLSGSEEAAVVTNITEPELVDERWREDVNIRDYTLRTVINGRVAAPNKTREIPNRWL